MDKAGSRAGFHRAGHNCVLGSNVLGMRKLCLNNFGNNDGVRIIPEF